MNTHYSPSEAGYRIIGSNETFNRGLYGGHKNDGNVEKYFTLAGDQPLVMGAVTDWRAEQACMHAKCGVFMAGVALTPGVSVPVFAYDGSGERTSQWFHESPGTETTFRNGWMEHRVWPFFQCFPRVEAQIEVLPVQSHDGFLVTLRVTSEQRVHLVIGLGGVTEYIGRFEAPYVGRREFTWDDCVGNTVTTGQWSATISSRNGATVDTTVRIGTNLPVTVTVADAAFTSTPGTFLGADADIDPEADPAQSAPMVRMDCIVDQYGPLEGHVVVLRNESEEALRSLVDSMAPEETIKRRIRRKQDALVVATPDNMLDLTVPANVVAMDACWQDNAFYHGAYAWHCPYIGWRNWYGPTVLGQHDRVEQAFRTHAATQVDGADRADGEAERVEYTGPGPYSRLSGSYGYLPEIPDGRNRIFYTMQEVGVDMILHSIEWTGNLAYAGEVFDTISQVLDWEERILDPDGDGLYQNWLNTWISDAHSYNGGGCAQSSAYNYSANTRMARIAELTGRDPEPFASRARRIRDALHRILWIPEKGVVAEYVDTIGNKLIHPSPELATIYHCIEADIVDEFQAYQMLRFSETDIRNESTINRGGRLAWSSNWYPQNYSSCGLYPAENIHLAWAYYQCGLSDKAHRIMTGIVDAHFMSRFPGLVAHCLSPQGYSSGSSDFSEISSMMLRTIVEGLFGVRVRLLDGYVQIAPCFPPEWDQAHMRTSDIELTYHRSKETETLTIVTEIVADGVIRMPMRRTAVADVTLNGAEVPYTIEPGIGRSNVVVRAPVHGRNALSITSAGEALPTIVYPSEVPHGEGFVVDAGRGSVVVDIFDPSGCLTQTGLEGGRLASRTSGAPGHHTVFVRVRRLAWDSWVPMDLNIVAPSLWSGSRPDERTAPPGGGETYRRVSIDDQLNCELTRIHQLEYRSPRPEAYSIMTSLNGRFGWDWNHCGHNAVKVDDAPLRDCGGIYTVPSGVPFTTPSAGPNAACVSLWDNFPDQLTFALDGTADSVAVFFVGVTNPMQSRVENARLEVSYADGSREIRSLVNPESFDDWLNAAFQTRHETVYFNEYNHGTVAHIRTDPGKRLRGLSVKAVANEVIIGIIGVTTVQRPDQEG